MTRLDGGASCSRNISRAALGYRVHVHAVIDGVRGSMGDICVKQSLTVYFDNFRET